MIVSAIGLRIASELASKIKVSLASLVDEVSVVLLDPMVVELYLIDGQVNLILMITPILGKVSMPVTKGITVLSGFEEQEALEEIQPTAHAAFNRG